MRLADLATILTIVATAVATAVMLSRKLDRIERRIGGLGDACIEFWRALLRHGLIGGASSARIAAGLGGVVGADAVEATVVEIEKTGGNPFTHEEAAHLRLYWERARHGGTFTQTEANEFRRLAARASQERPDDPGASMLKALGGLAVATAVGVGLGAALKKMFGGRG